MQWSLVLQQLEEEREGGWGGSAVLTVAGESGMNWAMADQTSGQRRATKQQNLLWKNSDERFSDGTRGGGVRGWGWGGEGVARYKVWHRWAACGMSGPSFGHGWQHHPRLLWRQIRTRKKGPSASRWPRDQKHCGAEIFLHFILKNCSSFEETFFLPCWLSMCMVSYDFFIKDQYTHITNICSPWS